MGREDSNEQLSTKPPVISDWRVAQVFPEQMRRRDETIDLTQLWGMVRESAGLVFAIAAVVFVAVMTHCLTSNMRFKSVARMYLGELEGKQTAGGNLDITAGGISEISSEIEVLRSRSMVKRAVLAAGLNATVVPPGWQLPTYWRWLLSRRDPALLDGAATQLAAVDTRLPEHVVAPRGYAIKFVTDTEYLVSGSGLEPTRGVLGRPLKTDELSLTLVAKREPPKPGATYDLFVRPLDEVVSSSLGNLTVTTPKTSGGEPARVLILEFSSTSRRHAPAFLGELMRGYLDARHAWKTEDASAAENFVTEQLQAMQQSLDRTQQKLAEYRADNRVVTLASEADSLVRQVGEYEQQRMAANLQVANLRAIKRTLNSRDAPIEAHMFGEASDAVLQRMALSLSEAREKVNDMSSLYSPAAPEAKRAEAQLRSQLGAVRNYVDGKLVRAEQSVAALTRVINDLESRLRTVPGAELRLSQIGRESEVYSRMYSYLLERQQQAAISKASTVSKNRILDVPQVPIREDSPKLGLHLASGPLGLLFGAAIVILRGLFSGVFRRENDVRVVLGPVQVFARVPTRLSRARPKGNLAWPAAPLFDVLASDADPSYAEAFRSLRTNLYRALPGEHGKVILVTSPTRDDGKTTCALSLAAMLAADNRRVLVIDTDVRRPTHHTLLGVAQEPGLRDVVLKERVAWRDATRTICLSVGWFDAISAGGTGSAELLSESYFTTFLVHARSHYDFIVLDSSSYPLVSDSLMLAPMSDFVLSVLRLGNTPRKLAEEHLSGLLMVARDYALVVNGVEAPAVFGVTNAAPSLASTFRRHG